MEVKDLATRPYYYKQTHLDFAKKVQDFVEKNINPYIDDWESEMTYPKDLHERMYKAGIYKFDFHDREYDAFHLLLLADGLARCGTTGLPWALYYSTFVSLAPVMKFGIKGNPALERQVIEEASTGKAIMALAVSEPYAGSDVAGLRCTAVAEQDHFVVNGAKKWITSGGKAKYFTVAVRTEKGGLSLLLIDAKAKGIKVRRMKTQGMWISYTAYITFDDVRVPKKNLIGVEGQGLKMVLSNFNHERLAMSAMALRLAYICIDDSVRYGKIRKTFGKRLIDHQAIRHKVAEMTRRAEAARCYMEQCTNQYAKGASEKDMAGPIAMLKVQTTTCQEFCAREASQIFGGSCYVRGEGKGKRVERIYRDVRFSCIAGGSVEILLGLAMKQARL